MPPDAKQWPVEALPDDALTYLLGSRIATRKNSQTKPGLFLAKSNPAGLARKRSVNMFTIASSSGISTPGMIAQRGKDMRSALAFAAILPTSLLRSAGA